MAPNLLVKAAFVQENIDGISYESEKNSFVRTEYILENIFSYLIKDKFEFDPIPAASYKEEAVLKEVIDVVNSFKSSYDSAMKKLCSEMEVTEDIIGSVLLGISNEVFCEGVTWSRIVSFFVFVGEMTVQCLCRGLDNEIVDTIFDCFRGLVKEKLQRWIENHGSWEGIRSLSKKSQTELSEQSSSIVDSPTSGWAKGILRGTVHLIGTIANIASQRF